VSASTTCSARSSTRSPRGRSARTPEWADARAEVAGLVRSLGWDVRPDAPALDQLADLLVAVRAVTGDPRSAVECFGSAAHVAGGVAEAEVRSLAGGDRTAMARGLVAGTVLGGRAFDALRRLAHEDASARVFGGPGADPGEHTPTSNK
jgi:hypothetical protein